MTPAGHKVQMQYTEPVKGGGGTVLKDMNIRLHGDAYKKVIGKIVSVPVGIRVALKHVSGLYIPMVVCLPYSLQVLALLPWSAKF